MQITTVGLDIAKNVFQVHGIDAAEKVVVRKQLGRKQMMSFFEGLPPCLVGLEACATSHHWARELTRLGHQPGSGQAQNERVSLFGTDQRITSGPATKVSRMQRPDR
jgi:hypothetical protein